jgi:hypothetical protein
MSSTLGSSKEFSAVDDRRAAICWLVLDGPWKSCSRPHKISQSPTSWVFEKAPQLVSNLVFNLVDVLVESQKKTGFEFIMPYRPLGIPGKERRRGTNKCSVVCK